MNDNQEVLEAWRAWPAESQSAWAFIHQETLPKIDDLTPAHLVDFLSSEEKEPTAGESDRSVLRFLLHIWNYKDHPFDVGEIVSWSRRDLKMFANWLTMGSKPCPVFLPEKHGEPYGQESEIHDPQFTEVHHAEESYGPY
jgi:hypothetical protein